jgi:NAD+ synthase (glutamine-hydrolysing)
MKISVAQLDIIAGHPDVNVSKILLEIEKARNNNVDIIVFSEMTVPGYLIGDEWENASFIKDCFSYNETIKNATEGIIAIWGNVDIDFDLKNEDGRIRKYNAAFIAQNCEYVKKIIPHSTKGVENLSNGRTYKTLMPKYREFDDERHFYSLRKLVQDKGSDIDNNILPFLVNINGEYKRIGIILCEDMWSDDYTINPIDILLKYNSDVIVNLSCSPWTWRKNNKRHSVVRGRIKNKPTYFVYCNNTGTQNNGKNIFLFDGGSTIYNPDGSLLCVAKDYTEETITATLFADKISLSNPEITTDQDKKELFNGLVYGIKKFFDTLPSKKAVIGLSGGVDSALDICLLVEALGAENVYAINMPSKFNSNTTKDAALLLAKNLGVHYSVISIQKTVENTISEINNSHFVRLNDTGAITPLNLSGLNIENIQARDRGSRVLAGVASALGAVFINNGNKTETAFGYATLYGDINGAIAPLADLYKHEVYELAKYYNILKRKEIIPSIILNIVASAELSDDQNVDEGKGDPIIYPYHDKLVRAFVEFRLDPEDILRLYSERKLAETFLCDQKLIDNFSVENFIIDLEQKWKAYKLAIFKRIQAPPIIAVSRRAFGFDLRESQNSVHFTQEYYKLKKLLLEKYKLN